MAVEPVCERQGRHLRRRDGLRKDGADRRIPLGGAGQVGNVGRQAPRVPAPRERLQARALVVVPKSTLDNWKRELSTWGCFKVQEMYGAGRERAFDAARNRECEVVLTTYDTVLNNLEDIKKVEWEVSVWDEVHQIKNEKSKRNRACNAIPCKRRYDLTGTPMSNEYKELWVMFDFASSGNVGTVKDFNARYGKALADGFNKSAKQWQIQRGACARRRRLRS